MVKVETFLLVQAAVYDAFRDSMTLCCILNRIAINPDTHTNDRFDVAIELAELPSGPVLAELRIERLGDDPAIVHRGGMSIDPALLDQGSWITFMVHSLPPSTWRVGEMHAVSFYVEGALVAVRELPCVPIEDSRDHSP